MDAMLIFDGGAGLDFCWTSVLCNARRLVVLLWLRLMVIFWYFV